MSSVQTETVKQVGLNGKLSVTTGQPIAIGSLTCIPLHPTFCAESVSFMIAFERILTCPRIRGIDFTKPVSDEQIKDVIAAQNRYGWPRTCMSLFQLTWLM